MTRPNRPDKMAWIQRTGTWGLRVMAIVLLLALTFTMVNVQQFSAHSDPGSWWWWAISWLLDPMASITMAAAIVFEGFLADYGRRTGWLTATKWYAGIAVWAMNVWDPLVHGIPSGVLLHSVAPGIVVGLAEAAPRVRRHIADILSEVAEPTVETAPPQLTRPTPAPAPQLPTQLPAPTANALIPPTSTVRATTTPVVTPPVDVSLTAHSAPTPTPRPTPVGDITPELVNRARKLRDTRRADGKSCGRRVLMEELGVRDRVARELATHLTEPTRLERVS